MRTITLFIAAFLLADSLLLTGCNSGTSTVTPQTSSENMASGKDFVYRIEALTGEVSDLVSQSDNTMPSSIAEEQQTQFFDLKDKIEALDHKLEQVDDQLDNAYRLSTITHEEYLELEHRLETLEDLLDASEEKLEFTFGMK